MAELGLLSSNLKRILVFQGCVFFRETWPETTTLKAIDYWCAICYFMAFGTLTEYCIVLYLDKTTWSKKSHGTIVAAVRSKYPERSCKSPPCPQASALRVEAAAKIFFPGSFVVANLGFWIYATSN